MNYQQIIFGTFFFLFSIASYAQYTAIPGTNFEQKLIDLGVDSEGTLDGQILTSDALGETMLDISSSSISNITGIEAFTNLTHLFLSDNQVSSLNVSALTNLIELECSINPIGTLNVTVNTSLERLGCSENQLSALDVSNNTALTRLVCSTNSLTSLNLSTNTLLTELQIQDNPLGSIDVSKNTALISLFCSENQLSSLDVTLNTSLENFDCSNNSLTTLDVTQNTSLLTLYCSHNQFSSINISQNTSLQILQTGGNPMNSIDISLNTSLNELSVSFSPLTSLDVSNNTSLTDLFCSGTSVTSLDITNNPNIAIFEFDDNSQLNTIDARNGNNTNISNSGFYGLNNSSLSCISVDDETWSTNNWTNIDMGTIFSNDCSLLPIELLSFTAKLTTESILLEWETVSESENKGFEIEHSTDLTRWESLPFVKGNGTTTQISNYEYEHRNPHFGMNYYRLKQIDFDNSSQYSKIVNIHFERENSVQLFPNPTNGILEIDGLNIENAQVKIQNTAGKVVFEKAIKNEFLDISELPIGLYFLELNVDNQLIVEKILKE